MAASEVWPTNKQWTKLFTVNINGIMLDQAIANSSDVPAGGIEGLLVEWAAGIPPPLLRIYQLQREIHHKMSSSAV